jgi:hypothetical protein
MSRVSDADKLKGIIHSSSGRPWGASKVVGDLPQNRFGRRIAKKLAMKRKKK